MEYRLQKIIADQGICSRREAERLIQEGFVRLNGKVVTEMGVKADPKKDTITVDQKKLDQKEKEKVIIALWKPCGFVCSTKKTAEDPDIVLDLIPKKYHHLVPVGRLDKDSSGLLILSNDGDLTFRLTHPKFSHQKIYHVLLHKPLEEDGFSQIRKGEVRILGGYIQPAPIQKLGGARVEIILREGKNRQIRRMFRALGNGVKKLRRVAVGTLDLADLRLREGHWKILSPREIDQLFETGH